MRIEHFNWRTSEKTVYSPAQNFFSPVMIIRSGNPPISLIRKPMHIISPFFRIVLLAVCLHICLGQQALADETDSRQSLRFFFSNNVLGELEPCG
jgi:hypothetical protein